MSKKLNQLPEKQIQLDQNDLILVSSNNVSKSVKVSTLEAPLKQYSRDKASEALASAESMIDIEQSARLAGDSDLASAINASNGDISQLNSDLSIEISRAMDVESDLQSQISAIDASKSSDIAELSGQIAQEISDRNLSEYSIRNQISQELSSRQSADAGLQTQINNILNNVNPSALDSLSEVVAAFQSADGSLQGAITTLASSGGLSSEISRAQAAEGSLQSAIASEISERNAALALKANSSDVSASLALKADSSSVYTKSQSDSNFESKNSNIQSHVSSKSNPHEVTKSQVGLGNVDNTSDNDKPVSFATQTALDLKANSSDVTSSLALKANSSDVTTSLSTKANVSDVSSSLALKANVSDVYTKSEITTSLAAKANISDVDTSLALKADSSSVYTKAASDSNYEPKNSNIQAHVISTSNPHEVTKAQVGLGNVDNTSDASKPVSSATQTALNLKANLVDVYTKTESDSAAASTLASSKTYTDGKVAALVNSSPATLDTLSELASALGNDPSFATTTATLIGTKANASDVTTSLAAKADSSSVYTKTASDANYEPKNSNIQSHVSSTSNPHGTTKAQVGLGNVDNTSDASKPVSSATQTALDLKANSSDVTTSLAGKVDKVTGKGLSTEDYTSAEKTKLSGIATGATANATDAQLRDRTTHTGSESTLPFSEVSVPSNPASGMSVFSNGSYGRQMASQAGKFGKPYIFQPHVSGGKIVLHSGNVGLTTFSTIGAGAPLASNGTQAARNIASTNFFTWQKRTGVNSSNAINSAAGWRSSGAMAGIGNVANAGGFHFVARFGHSDATFVAGSKTFVGLNDTTTAYGTVEPSTYLNQIGIGCDSTDTNFQIMHNGSSGTCTKIDLGSNFSAQTTKTDMIEVSFYCQPNSTTIYYSVTNLSTGNTTSGTLSNTAKLPAAGTLFTWHVNRSTGGVAGSASIDLCSIYIETEG